MCVHLQTLISVRLTQLSQNLHTPRDIINNIAALIQNLFEAGGPEGTKSALGSGLLDLTVKLLHSRDPIPVSYDIIITSCYDDINTLYYDVIITSCTFTCTRFHFDTKCMYVHVRRAPVSFFSTPYWSAKMTMTIYEPSFESQLSLFYCTLNPMTPQENLTAVTTIETEIHLFPRQPDQVLMLKSRWDLTRDLVGWDHHH